MRPCKELATIDQNLFRNIDLGSIHITSRFASPRPGQVFVISVMFPVNSHFYHTLKKSDLFQRTKKEWISYLMENYGEAIESKVQSNYNNKLSLIYPSELNFADSASWCSGGFQFDLEAILEEEENRQKFKAEVDQELVDRLLSYPDNFFQVLERLSKDQKLLNKLAGQGTNLREIKLLDFINHICGNAEIQKNVKLHQLMSSPDFSDGIVDPEIKQALYQAHMNGEPGIELPLNFTSDCKVGFVLRQPDMKPPRTFETGADIVWVALGSYPNMVNYPEKGCVADLQKIIETYNEEILAMIDEMVMAQMGVKSREGHCLLVQYNL